MKMSIEIEEVNIKMEDESIDEGELEEVVLPDSRQDR